MAQIDNLKLEVSNYRLEYGRVEKALALKREDLAKIEETVKLKEKECVKSFFPF